MKAAPTSLAGAWAAAFEARDAVATRSPAWLRSLRHAARERLFALPAPDVRQEEWRFTNPAPIVTGRFADADVTAPAVRAGALPAGAWAGGLAEAFDDAALAPHVERTLGAIAAWQERVFLALNTALVADGALVYAPAGARFASPVRLVHGRAGRASGGTGARAGEGAGPWASQPRALVVAEPGARLTVIEDFRAAHAAGDWVNSALEIDVQEGARVEHVALLPAVAGALHSGAVFARVAAGGELITRSFALGGRLTRRDVHVTFTGAGARAELEGVFVTGGDDLVDHHTTVDHAVPGCTSREDFKGVLAGRSRGVFNGAVVIRPGAQKSDARQHNGNLLLSADATVNSKPELMIFADDVKCGHGATVGELDPAALFYLRARGLGEAEARALLTRAFVKEIVDHLAHDELRAEVEAFTAARLSTLGGAA